MSLAHIRAWKVERSRKAKPGPTPTSVATGPTGHCGASREPVYRTVGEASESGLEICDACLAIARTKRPQGSS